MTLSNILSLVIIICIVTIFILSIKDQIKIQNELNNSKYKIYTFDNGYGYINHKRITIDDVKSYRNLPDNNNLYYNAALMSLNEFDYNPNYLFGAIILQWIKNGIITLDNNNSIYLTKQQQFENVFEEKLFSNLQKASKNNILEENELKSWVKSNYYSFYDILMLLTNSEIKKLREANHIKPMNKSYVMDEEIYNDSVKLLGLKKYLMNFSSINEKEINDVHIWEDYLIYANLFGIADRINKKMQNHYPNLSEYSNIDRFVAGVLAVLFVTSNND